MNIIELEDTIVKDLRDLIEKEKKITDVYHHNVHRSQELWEAAQAYALEKSKGDVSLQLVIQLAFLVGTKWADEHPRKSYKHEAKDL